MKETPESKIQQECYTWFNNTYCLKHHNLRLIIHSVPNGVPIPLPPKILSRVLDLLHKMGMVNGISDLIIHGVNGRCVMAECKTETGVQSPAQKEIQKRMQQLGGVYFIFRNLEQFQTEIRKNLVYLTIP